MKKVILRIVVAAIALALIVLILINTVFKTPSTLKAYNTLNDALSTNGQITKLSEGIKDSIQEFKEKYGDMVEIYDAEVVTLQENYSKLYYLKDVDDKAMSSVSVEVEALVSNLNAANKKLDDVKALKQNNAELNVNQYVEDIKIYVVNSLSSISNLNTSISDFLVTNYYGGAYGEHMFLGKLKTEIAREYYNVMNMSINKKEDDTTDYSAELVKVHTMYMNLNTNGLYANDVASLNIVYDIMAKAKNVNIGRVVSDFKKYAEENKIGDADKQNKDKINKLRDIGFVMQFINEIGDKASDLDKKFIIRDSADFVMQELPAQNN